MPVVVHKDPYAFQVSDETRRKVAAKHRLVQQIPSRLDSNPIQPYFNEKYDNVQVSDLDGGDYQQRSPDVFLNPPNAYMRGDQGPERDDQSQSLYVPKQILVHLDLKGAPPKMDFLLKFLKLIKDWGATGELNCFLKICLVFLIELSEFFLGILVEYEDMFPFEGMLKEVAATNHYNKSDIFNLLIKSKELGLEVIPLVQTFGHMEFILKHGQFAHLRDSPQMPESICSCHEQSMSLIGLYIDQIMTLHKDVKHLHIGCDEVYHLGECSACEGQSRTDVFIKHVSNVANYVKSKYPQV